MTAGVYFGRRWHRRTYARSATACHIDYSP